MEERNPKLLERNEITLGYEMNFEGGEHTKDTEPIKARNVCPMLSFKKKLLTKYIANSSFGYASSVHVIS